MDKFTILTSEAVLLPVNNIDTDQIIPARFLKTTEREKFGDKLFYDRRYGKDGALKKDFPINTKKGEILVAGKNFGCGSSREHAAWALYDYGFRAIISSSFADIFRNNALNNGLLPVCVSEPFYQKLTDILMKKPNTLVTIDLTLCTVEISDIKLKEKFCISPYKRDCLMSAYDDIDYLVANVNSDVKTIAVLPGDGIGPEIIEQAVKVAETISKYYPQKLRFNYASIGACAIDECGDPYPEQTDKICKETDAVLFGAIGDPKYDNNPSAKVRPEQGLLKMRKELRLFANIRPVHPYKALLQASPLKENILKGTDMIIIRELTGGIYFGQPRGRSENGNTAFDSCVYSRDEIVRIAKTGFEYAMRRRKKLTLVDKANVLATSRLWRETVAEMGATKYPEVEIEYMFVDNAAMKLVMAPASFDVILTENMFGDILSDMGGAIGGSIGLMPSASVGLEYSLFEPIHGSFPQAKGLNIANPIATILSLAMLYEDALGARREAMAIRCACNAAIENGVCTPDIFPNSKYGTKEVGDYIANTVRLLM